MVSVENAARQVAARRSPTKAMHSSIRVYKQVRVSTKESHAIQ